LEINESFPSGMKAMVEEIRKKGFKAGIWFAPFVATSKSRVYFEHKDWFLKSESGRLLEGRQSSPVDFLPALSLKVLDPTHPEVEIYIEKVVKKFLEWGFELIKIDFTYPVCFSNNYYLPMTRAQALRTGYRVIRKAAGDETHLMSAISQLSPLVGLVDSARVGIDTINPYVADIPVIGKIINNYMFKESMRNSSSRLFLNGKVWINDADCFVGRSRTGLSRSQISEQFDFIKNNRAAVWIGDSFKTMTKTNLDKYVDLFKRKPIK
jgi:alpha-galactosidase